MLISNQIHLNVLQLLYMCYLEVGGVWKGLALRQVNPLLQNCHMFPTVKGRKMKDLRYSTNQKSYIQ